MNDKKGQKPGQNRRKFITDTGHALGVLSAGSLLGFGLGACNTEPPAKTATNQLPGLVGKETSDYERFRKNTIWNERKPERYPDGICFPESDQDVIDVVNYARETGQKIAIRSGGHNWIGNHVRDQGLLVDLSHMHEITVDPDKGTATIQPAARARNLQTRLNEQGFRFPTATCPSVGMGGYLLGGGASFTTRLDGASCYGVEAADVVLANGEFIHATDETHPEIMWALRGSGPMFFGLVTRFYLKLKPLPKTMLTSAYAFPSQVSKPFIDWHLSISKDLPAEIQHTWFAVKNLMPQFPGVPFMLSTIGLGDSDEEVRSKMAVFDECPVLDKALFKVPAHPWNFDQGYSDVDFLYPKGYRFRSDALWIEDPMKEGFSQLVADIMETMPNLHSHLLWAPYYSGHFESNSCFPFEQTPPLSLHLYGVGKEVGEDARLDSWVNDWLKEIQKYSPYGGSGKMNDNDVLQFPKYTISPESTDRVEMLQLKYDPLGVFHRQLGGVRPNPIST